MPLVTALVTSVFGRESIALQKSTGGQGCHQWHNIQKSFTALPEGAKHRCDCVIDTRILSESPNTNAGEQVDEKQFSPDGFLSMSFVPTSSQWIRHANEIETGNELKSISDWPNAGLHSKMSNEKNCTFVRWRLTRGP